MSIESTEDLAGMQRVGRVVPSRLPRCGLPRVSASRSRAVTSDDGWTMRTHNRCVAVHEEHTVVINDGAPLVVTAA